MKQNSHTKLGLHFVIKHTSHNAGVMETPVQNKVIISCHGSEGLHSSLHFAQLSAYIKKENEENSAFSEAQKRQALHMYPLPSNPHPPPKKKVEERGGSEDEIWLCWSSLWNMFLQGWGKPSFQSLFRRTALWKLLHTWWIVLTKFKYFEKDFPGTERQGPVTVQRTMKLVRR